MATCYPPSQVVTPPEVPFEAETWGTPLEREPEYIPEIPPDLRR